jgi:dihydroorotate dehydrogenase
MKSPLNPPLFNGGGCCKTVKDVREAAGSVAGAIVVGSYTVDLRDVNPGNTFWIDGGGTAHNSLGMPNLGKPYIRQNLPEMCAIAHGAGKALIVNVAGFTPAQYGELTETAFEGGADAVELNLGCPNVVTGDNSRKPIPSYDPEIFAEILAYVGMFVTVGQCPVWVKVSPNTVASMIKILAGIVAEHTFVTAVTDGNTLPDGYAVDPFSGKPRIGVGFAGMSGTILRYYGPGQNKKWREALPDHVSLIASGGISSGRDIQVYTDIGGAVAFQVTTELLRTGKLNLHPLGRIAGEYLDL